MLVQLAEQLQKDSKNKKYRKKDNNISWNREGHRIQHEFLIEALDALIDIEDDIDKGVDRDSSIVKIQSLKDAAHPETGVMTVQTDKDIKDKYKIYCFNICGSVT